MADKLYTVEELEKKTGWHYLSTEGVDLKEKKTEADWMEYVLEPKNQPLFGYVLYDYRVNWLKENGYELNRGNLLNAELSVKKSEAQAE